MSGYLDTFCWECDRQVHTTGTGWYRCSHCGYESVRAPELSCDPLPLDFNSSAGQTRSAQRDAGLVSLFDK